MCSSHEVVLILSEASSEWLLLTNLCVDLGHAISGVQALLVDLSSWNDCGTFAYLSIQNVHRLLKLSGEGVKIIQIATVHLI